MILLVTGGSREMTVHSLSGAVMIFLALSMIPEWESLVSGLLICSIIVSLCGLPTRLAFRQCAPYYLKDVQELPWNIHRELIFKEGGYLNLKKRVENGIKKISHFNARVIEAGVIFP